MRGWGMCSKHYGRARAGNPLSDPGPRPCAFCEESFDSPRLDQRYCSRPCERRANERVREPLERTGACDTCGSAVIPGARGAMPKACPECQREARRVAALAWKRRNRDEYNAARRGKGSTEAIRARARERHAKMDPAAVAMERRRRYLAEPVEIRRARTAKYDAAHPGKRAELENRRRARKLAQFVATVDPAAIWERDKGICQLCMRAIAEGERSLDHIIPLALGGTHEPANIQLAHRRCNSRKGARLTMPTAA